MGMETRHMHLYVFCRVHPNDQELAPLGEEHGVFTTLEQVERALDEMVEAGKGFDSDIPLVEFRHPGMLGIQTAGANDKRSIEYGGDGRCHRVFMQVWCIGDPDECRAMIEFSAQQKTLDMLPQMLASEDPHVQEAAMKGMAMLLKEMMGGLGPDEDEPDFMRLPELPKQRDFGVGYANEPFDDFLDFGGFDEPKDPKRLN